MADSFGNEIDSVTGFAPGRLIHNSADINLRARWAQEIIRKRKKKGEGIYNFIGVNTSFPIETADLEMATDELVGASFYVDKLRKMAIEHLGGDPREHEVLFCNRLSAGNVATVLSFVKEGDILLSYIAPPRGFTHSSIRYGTKLAGAAFVEAVSPEEVEKILEEQGQRISLVMVTGTNTALTSPTTEQLEQVVKDAKARNKIVYIDDASGARLRPVLYEQPKSLKLGVDLAGTSGEKLLPGPRSGWIAGNKELVEKVNNTLTMIGGEMRPPVRISLLRGLEKYDPESIVKMKEHGEKIYHSAKRLYGDRAEGIFGGIHIRYDDNLSIVLDKLGGKEAEIVPVEASVGAGVCLLEDFGIMTVAGVWDASGTFSLRLKPIAKEGKRFGSPEQIVRALDRSYDRVADNASDVDNMGRLLFGKFYKHGKS